MIGYMDTNNVYTINTPMPFPGTDAEVEANRATHDFDDYTDRCTGCDCRPWGIVAQWPCGTRPPRIDVDEDTASSLYNGTPFARTLT